MCSNVSSNSLTDCGVGGKCNWRFLSHPMHSGRRSRTHLVIHHHPPLFWHMVQLHHPPPDCTRACKLHHRIVRCGHREVPREGCQYIGFWRMQQISKNSARFRGAIGDDFEGVFQQNWQRVYCLVHCLLVWGYSCVRRTKHWLHTTDAWVGGT